MYMEEPISLNTVFTSKMLISVENIPFSQKKGVLTLKNTLEYVDNWILIHP